MLSFSTLSPTIHSFSLKIFLGLRFYVLPHIKCIEFLFWVTNNEELYVPIQPVDNVVLIGNQPFSLWVTATKGHLSLGWFIQNPFLLTKVARCKRTQSDFILCHFILPKCWWFNSKFGSEFGFQLNGFAMRISFWLIFDHKR